MAHTAKVLTIAVAAYNVAPYIAQCLDSFVDEKLLPALDIVVIDDGSTDATARIVRKYIKRFPESFRLVSQENGGYGAAVNHALALAQGEYFKTVDGDDWVDTKELLTVVCYLMDNRERSDVVVTDYCWVRHRDGKEIRRIKTDFAQKQYQHIYSFDEIADKVYLNMHAVTIRTALLQSHNIQLDEHCFYVDAQYVLRPVPYIETVVFLPGIVYQYRLGTDGQSMNLESMQKNYLQHEKVLQSIIRLYEQEDKSSLAKRAYLAKGAAKLMTSQVKIYLSFRSSRRWKMKIKQLVDTIEANNPEIFHACNNRAVKLLYRTNYRIYPAASFLLRLQHTLHYR